MNYTYDKRYCMMLRTHFAAAPGTWTEPDEKGKTRYVANPLPTFAGFALKIGVPQETLREWAKQYDDFGHAWAMAREAMADVLVQNMLQGAYNSSSAIYAAKNMMGLDLGAAKEAPDPDGEENEQVVEMSDREAVKRIMYLMQSAGVQVQKRTPLAPTANNAIMPQGENK